MFFPPQPNCQVSLCKKALVDWLLWGDGRRRIENERPPLTSFRGALFTVLRRIRHRGLFCLHFASARNRATSSGWKSSLRQSRTGRSLPLRTQLRTVCGLTHKAFATDTSVKSWGMLSDTTHLAKFRSRNWPLACGPPLPASGFPRLGRARNTRCRDSIYLSLWN
jgi:hypothetical protein